MKRSAPKFRIVASALIISAFAVFSAKAVETNLVAQQIDLATVLKLAGAQNSDVQIARERVTEARANLEAANWQFLPWIAPGVVYRAHDNAIQDVGGSVINVHKDTFAVGPTIGAQVDLGDAIYKRLTAIQLAKAAEYASAAEQADAILNAAIAYFELSRTAALIAVLDETVRISDNYARQLESAVDAGVAFKGDALKARTQAERNKIALRQAHEDQGVAGARLAQVLHLNAPIELTPRMDEFVPVTLTATNLTLGVLVESGLAARPELRQSEATVAAANDVEKSAKYGPLIPSVGAQAFVGGLGGGNQNTYRGLSESEDYQITATWRIGPGGIFDRTRIRGAESRLKIARYTSEKLRDEIIREVVEAYTKTQSEADQLALNKRAVTAAEESYRLARGRRDAAISSAFETIFAEQEYTRLRQDYVTSISDFNKAQYLLTHAIGQIFSPTSLQK